MADFKVIIIGGGPVGLAMAHCLRLAGIEYVLFEQRATVIDKEGAAISLMPHVVRLLHQFGLLDEVKRWATPVHSTVHVAGDDKGWRDANGDVLAEK
jgi:2-polyprenyl-6-methoxyphenol hydroxylase-like FAD-dependent oxidoreductase